MPPASGCSPWAVRSPGRFGRNPGVDDVLLGLRYRDGAAARDRRRAPLPGHRAVALEGQRAGYVVNWRRVPASPEATRRFQGRVGVDAALLGGKVGRVG